MSGADTHRKRNIQAQLHRLLFALVVLSAVNATFFWKTLSQLFDSYRSVSQGQTRMVLAGELQRDFFEENRLRGLDDGDPEKASLPEVRSHIRKLFRDIRNGISEKSAVAEVKSIEKAWNNAHDAKSSNNLLVLTRHFVSNEQKTLTPLEASADAATKGMNGFLLLYVMVMAITILVLMQFMRRRLFRPLFHLSEKMKYFQAGKVELPPLTAAYDEIGDLEEKFYDMAGRVGHTVTELKELDKVKTDFISIASHELRTPMTSVKGSLSLILTGNLAELSPDVREILTIAEKETDRLIRLINDILDLTKMEAKKLPLDKKWCDLGEIIQAAVNGLGGLFEVTKVTVRIQKSDEVIKALVDHDRIQQVITNLLSNAVKFSPAESEVVIYCGEHEDGAIIKVRDSGPGIKAEDQPIVFEKFRSTDPRKSKIIKGTGLGLPICKALVEQHGGLIGLESEPGHGSTFYFTVPEVKMRTGKPARGRMSVISDDSLKALQGDYMKGFPAKWKLMTDAFKNQSWTMLERELHKFAGSGATYKMPEISKLAKAIEIYLEKNSPPNVDLLWEAMEVFRQVLDGRQNDQPAEIDDHEIFQKLA